mgnify:CR=1 FL=1
MKRRAQFVDANACACVFELFEIISFRVDFACF